ncbi:PaaI family thioesterase [Pseudohongiella spirulinae]|uniref:Thioesterase superfamily protein n=1 Tax=Pseudohongiella spirulinae TaxID=1249552 RepID=A0A0S2KAV4_9GAMM|nr:PaaI family thioesterase [Pseudohongiella spirulinae]ALO45462.1 Thioesterase superfamily protein [Pseudohongiella spirulinae]
MSSKFKAEDFGIPAHFEHWDGDNAEDQNGPFFFCLDGNAIQTAFRVRAENCNAHKTLHGGISMMFADYTLCLAAIGGSHDGVLTVSCNSEFLGPAYEGELVTGHGEVLRKGKSIVFARTLLTVDDRPVLSASAVLKLVQRRG